MQRVLRRIVTLSFLFVTACDDATAIEGCQGDIDVTLSGPPLVFHWTPNCGISQLVVVEVDATPTTVWSFGVPENDPLRSGVTYGTSPARATVWVQPTPLEIGRAYQVIVRYTLGGDGVSASGSRTFTWSLPD